MNTILSFAIFYAAFTLANGQQNATCVHTRLITPRHFFDTDRVTLLTILGQEYTFRLKGGTKPGKLYTFNGIDREVLNWGRSKPCALKTILGKWYGIELYSGLTADVHPLAFKCLEIEYNRTSIAKELDASETLFNLDTQATQVYPERIVIDSANELEAIWKVYAVEDGVEVEADSVWLQTDYDNWAIVFSCGIEDGYRREQISIISRTRVIDQNTWEILKVLATGYGFPPTNAMPIDQTGCLNVK